MSRITIESGPARFMILAIVGVIRMFVKRRIVLHSFNHFGGFIFPESDVRHRLPR